MQAEQSSFHANHFTAQELAQFKIRSPTEASASLLHLHMECAETERTSAGCSFSVKGTRQQPVRSGRDQTSSVEGHVDPGHTSHTGQRTSADDDQGLIRRKTLINQPKITSGKGSQYPSISIRKVHMSTPQMEPIKCSKPPKQLYESCENPADDEPNLRNSRRSLLQPPLLQELIPVSGPCTEHTQQNDTSRPSTKESAKALINEKIIENRPEGIHSSVQNRSKGSAQGLTTLEDTNFSMQPLSDSQEKPSIPSRTSTKIDDIDSRMEQDEFPTFLTPFYFRSNVDGNPNIPSTLAKGYTHKSRDTPGLMSTARRSSEEQTKQQDEHFTA